MLQNHYLDDLFHPESVAVVGASDREGSVGQKVMSNIRHSKFLGNLFAVNPKHQKVQGRKCYPSVKDLPGKIDLAVITTPALTVPDILRECGEKGIRSAIIISAGFSEMGQQGKELEQSILEIARQFQIHFIGPNCLGIMRPDAHLNATFDNNFALPGDIALLSQSGAICAAILDWAIERQIGFSTIVSMGNSIDLDFGDVLDYLAMDPATKSILLYIEGVHYPRRFLSGLRAAARVKPVIAIKAGRHASGVRAVHSHTGALVGDDDIFSAALNRGGAVRVDTIEQLFTAAQVLSSDYRARGNRLTIITNGGGAGVMAADAATDLNIALPDLDENVITKLNDVLPKQWSHQNPIDILGDATPKRYQDVVSIGLNDIDSDALLTILVPVAMSEPHAVAEEICKFAEDHQKPIIACWMGEKQSKTSWELFAECKIPCYSTPEVAVEAFSYLANYHSNQQLLLQMPAPFIAPLKTDSKGANLIIETALADSRKVLTMLESKAVLSAFDIPVSPTILAQSAHDALIAAETIGFPVVMKISSPDITHKQDVGGVILNLTTGDAVMSAYQQMMTRVEAAYPKAQVEGVTVERMQKNPNDRELMIGVIRDKVFGPVITIGLGGSLVEVVRDRAVALPPLNHFLAEQMIERTKANRLLGEFRGKPAVNKDALIQVLLSVSDMVCELPQIQEMDINPLLINDEGALVVDARFVVAHSSQAQNDYAHMTIHPYPRHLQTTWQTKEGVTITLRPIRPEDALAEQAFIGNLSPAAKYFRFMHEVSELTPETLVRFTQVDYEREMAFVATVSEKQSEKIIGIARYYTQGAPHSCEFALAVADDWQNKGVGTHLMNALMHAAKEKQMQIMSGRILSENVSMIELAKDLGFIIRASDDENMKLAIKRLGE